MGSRSNRREVEKAALTRHLEVVKWLHESRYYEIRTFRSLENAITGGHLHNVQYVMETVEVSYTSWMQAALIAAATYGQCQILQWLHDRAAAELLCFIDAFALRLIQTSCTRWPEMDTWMRCNGCMLINTLCIVVELASTTTFTCSLATNTA